MNRLPNSGFEADISGVVATGSNSDWEQSDVSLSRSSRAKEGVWSLRAEGTSDSVEGVTFWDRRTLGIPIWSGKEYTFSGWLYPDFASGSVVAHMGIWWISAAGVELNHTFLSNSGNVTAGDGWAQKTFTGPAIGAFARPIWEETVNFIAGKAVLFDEMVFDELAISVPISPTTRLGLADPSGTAIPTNRVGIVDNADGQTYLRVLWGATGGDFLVRPAASVWPTVNDDVIAFTSGQVKWLGPYPAHVYNDQYGLLTIGGTQDFTVTAFKLGALN